MTYVQGEGDEEGAWYLHNAMRDPEGQAYHPECFKDKEAQERRSQEATNGAGDLSMEEEEVKPAEVKVEGVKVEQEDVKMEEVEVKVEDVVKQLAIKNEEELQAPVLNGLKQELEEDVVMSEPAPVKPEPTELPEGGAKPEDVAELEPKGEVKAEKEQGNRTVNLEAPEHEAQAPVSVPQPKVAGGFNVVSTQSFKAQFYSTRINVKCLMFMYL